MLEKNNTSYRKIKYNEDNTCPLCGSDNLDSKDDHISSGCYDIDLKCLDCGCTFSATYTIDFGTVHWVRDKDGNHYYVS